jgi:hypothetical protein
VGVCMYEKESIYIYIYIPTIQFYSLFFSFFFF